MLCIIAEDDTAMPPSVYKEMVRQIPEEKLHTIKSVFYPGAGHLIEPPYAPLCRASYMNEQFGKDVHHCVIPLKEYLCTDVVFVCLFVWRLSLRRSSRMMAKYTRVIDVSGE